MSFHGCHIFLLNRPPMFAILRASKRERRQKSGKIVGSLLTGCLNSLAKKPDRKRKAPAFVSRLLLAAFCFKNGLFGDPGAIRTRDVPLRRRKQGFPPTPLRCPQTLAITTFLTNSIVPDSSKKHLFYPSAISRKLAELILAVGHFPTAFAKISQMTDITFLKMPSNRRKIFSITMNEQIPKNIQTFL